MPRGRRSSRIALAALSGLLVALLSSNAYIEFYRRRATTEAAQTGARDTRSRVETIAALRDEGRLAYPPFSPWVVYQAHHEDRGGRELHSLFELESREVIPLTNVPRASIVLCNETGQWVVHETDEFGFSNPPDLWARAPVEVAVVPAAAVKSST